MPIKYSRIINVVEGEIHDANGWHFTIASTTFIMSVPETLRLSSQSRLVYLVI